MTLAKAYVIVAKEQNNLELAWEFSLQIRNGQRLLSQASERGAPITLEEANPIISQLAQLIYYAQDFHYHISTIIKTLKSHAHALEAHINAGTVQEPVPKSLHCFSIKLTEEWFRNSSVRKLSEDRRKPASASRQ